MEPLHELYDSAYRIYVGKVSLCQRQNIPRPQEIIYNFHRRCHECSSDNLLHLFLCMFAVADMLPDEDHRNSFIATSLLIYKGKVRLSDNLLPQWYLLWNK